MMRWLPCVVLACALSLTTSANTIRLDTWSVTSDAVGQTASFSFSFTEVPVLDEEDALGRPHHEFLVSIHQPGVFPNPWERDVTAESAIYSNSIAESGQLTLQGESVSHPTTLIDYDLTDSTVTFDVDFDDAGIRADGQFRYGFMVLYFGAVMDAIPFRTSDPIDPNEPLPPGPDGGNPVAVPLPASAYAGGVALVAMAGLRWIRRRK